MLIKIFVKICLNFRTFQVIPGQLSPCNLEEVNLIIEQIDISDIYEVLIDKKILW